MPLETLLLFLPACFALNLAFGPNNLLSLTNAAKQGVGFAISAFRQECLVALGNPKAILIFTAFFPQFVSPESYWQSFALLGALFLVLELIAIALYVCLGRFVAKAAAQRLVWLTRASGVAMIAFGSLLALSRREA